MAYILNEINVFSRDSMYAKRLTCMLNKDIKNRAKAKNIKAVEKRLNNAANAKQALENNTKRTNDVIKESAASKAYFNLK